MKTWEEAERWKKMGNNLWDERVEIIKTLSKRERKILYDYEKEYGMIMPGAIYKVVEDQKDLAKEKANQKKRRK